MQQPKEWRAKKYRYTLGEESKNWKFFWDVQFGKTRPQSEDEWTIFNYYDYRLNYETYTSNKW